MKYSNFLIWTAAASLIVSCQELDLHYEGGTMDEDQIVEAVEAKPDRINSSVSGMYAVLNKPYTYFGIPAVGDPRDDDFGYPCICLGQDLNGADMVNVVSDYDWFSPALEWSDRDPSYANPQMRLGLFYKIIYATKDVLGAIPAGDVSDELKYKRGQASAMRAFSYLSLAPYFQFKYVGNEDKPCVPLVSENTDPRNNPRASVRDVYKLIISDLTSAISDLDGFSRGTNKSIIDQNVAYGLRARAYLNMEEWENAASDADSAMMGYNPYTMNELTSPGFNDASDHNWIWALLMPSELVGEKAASWPSQLGSFSASGYVAYAGIYRSINKLLYDKIPDTDVRKKWWLNEEKKSSYLDGLQWKDVAEDTIYNGQDIADAAIADVKQPMDKYSNVKFGQRSGIGTTYNDGDWCMMRAEEMILIKAEATAKAGSLTDGKQILEDFVKTYRNPDYTCGATTVEAFSDSVWFQRRVELWGEGFAMSDIMRLNKPVVRYHSDQTDSNVPETYRFNVAAGDKWMLLRFVQKETTNNAGLINNEGGVQPKQGDGATLTDGVTD